MPYGICRAPSNVSGGFNFEHILSCLSVFDLMTRNPSTISHHHHHTKPTTSSLYTFFFLLLLLINYVTGGLIKRQLHRNSKLLYQTKKKKTQINPLGQHPANPLSSPVCTPERRGGRVVTDRSSGGRAAPKNIPRASAARREREGAGGPI